MMCTTLRSLTEFAIIALGLYSNSSTVYRSHTFAPADNQQKYSEISSLELALAAPLVLMTIVCS